MPLSSQLPFNFNLYNKFTFENLVYSDKNRELLDIISGSTTANTFYFIWGKQGSGKSHLLQASCAEHINAAYLPLKLFCEDGPAVLEGLEQLDWICIDDVQLVIGQPQWEEKLFSLFNACQENGKYLVLASVVEPPGLKYVLADLQSRFSSGVIYQLHELDEEEKIQALKQRAEDAGIPLQDEVLNFIYLRSERSMTSLFNVLEKLDQLSLSERRKITIPFVKDMMQW